MKYFLQIILFLLLNSKIYANSEIQKLENYLNSIQTIESQFIQLSPNAAINEGEFFLKKPGKFRWDYKDLPILIVSNGKSLIYYDKELEQKNYIPIENSIASLLTRKKIIFSNDIKIVDFNKTKDSTSITLTENKKRDIQKITLIFQNSPLALGKIRLVDNTGNEISISLFNVKLNHKISSELFQIKDNRFQ